MIPSSSARNPGDLTVAGARARSEPAAAHFGDFARHERRRKLEEIEKLVWARCPSNSSRVPLRSASSRPARPVHSAIRTIWALKRVEQSRHARRVRQNFAHPPGRNGYVKPSARLDASHVHAVLLVSAHQEELALRRGTPVV